MSTEELTAGAGIILSLVFSYVPQAKAWFDKQNSEMKRILMLAIVAMFATLVYSLACANLAADFGLSVTCDKASLIGLLRAVGIAAIANQTTYSLSPHKLTAPKANTEPQVL
jgi:hypothetical protein